MNKKNRKVIEIMILIFIIIYLYLSYQYYQNNYNLEVSFIDVGQGDAIFIKTPNKKKIIIDFGDQKGVKELNKKIPWWSKEVDLLIITHPHDDHIAGIDNVIKKYKIKNILLSGIEYDSPLYLDLLEKIKLKNIPIIIPSKNSEIILDEKCLIKIIYPFENLEKKEVANLNNSSIVTQLDCNNSKFLFTGDIENEVEKEIITKNINIKSDVLKIAHHGSISSSDEEFLEKVDPKIAIIMVGKNNKFNHPSLRILKRLEKRNILIFRTDQDGSIKIISDGKNIYKSN